MEESVKLLIFLRNEIVKGIRCDVVPYYDDNIPKCRISFHNSDITLDNVLVATENELKDNEDYRLSVEVDYCIFTLWYLPTRVANVLYITNFEVK